MYCICYVYTLTIIRQTLARRAHWYIESTIISLSLRLAMANLQAGSCLPSGAQEDSKDSPPTKDTVRQSNQGSTALPLTSSLQAGRQCTRESEYPLKGNQGIVKESPHMEEPSDTLHRRNIVLLGRAGVGKAAIVNAITRKETFAAESSIESAMRAGGTVPTSWLSLKPVVLPVLQPER